MMIYPFEDRASGAQSVDCIRCGAPLVRDGVTVREHWIRDLCDECSAPSRRVPPSSSPSASRDDILVLRGQLDRSRKFLEFVRDREAKAQVAREDAEREVATLRAEVQALRADGVRWNAVQRHGWTVAPDTGACWTVWASTPTGGDDCDEVELTRGGRPATVRAAVDAAITATSAPNDGDCHDCGVCADCIERTEQRFQASVAALDDRPVAAGVGG
jgi:hypothetical protein